MNIIVTDDHRLMSDLAIEVQMTALLKNIRTRWSSSNFSVTKVSQTTTFEPSNYQIGKRINYNAHLTQIREDVLVTDRSVEIYFLYRVCLLTSSLTNSLTTTYSLVHRQKLELAQITPTSNRASIGRALSLPATSERDGTV